MGGGATDHMQPHADQQPTDEAEIGAIIDEMYAMISGPVGPRDWSRHANCFLPNSRQVRTWVDEDGRPQMLAMGPEHYAANVTPFFMANNFYEVETGRRIDLFGNMAHVWSHYEARTSPRRRRCRTARHQLDPALPPRRAGVADRAYDLGQ